MLYCRWVPVGERSSHLALVYSGMYTGSIMGLALSPQMVAIVITILLSSDVCAIL